jgi:hypothetical protein
VLPEIAVIPDLGFTGSGALAKTVLGWSIAAPKNAIAMVNILMADTDNANECIPVGPNRGM